MSSSLFLELMGPARQVPGSISDPMVSFLVPTHGRAAIESGLLSELVYWFGQQTYIPREMLILNDVPDQTLICEAPGVRVINWPSKIRTLGEKRNLLTLMAAGSICVPQDDDDIPLPWRAEQAVLALREAEFWAPRLWWYSHAGEPMRPDRNGYGGNSAAYRRGALLGRYSAITPYEDREIVQWAYDNLKCNDLPLTDPADISYVYRWNVSRNHLSGFAPEMDQAYKEMETGPAGTYTIVPKMGETDWVAEHHRLTKK